MSVRKPWVHKQPIYRYRGVFYGSNRDAAVRDWQKDRGAGEIQVDYGHGSISIVPTPITNRRRNKWQHRI